MSKNTKRILIFLALCLLSLALWYFQVIGASVLVDLLVVEVVTFFAIRTAEKNLDQSNRY